MIDQNLLVVVQEPWSYVLPILSLPLPKDFVPGEHHVLKNLPFYEVAHAADAKTRQDQLDQRERSIGRELRQAPSGNRPTISFAACPLAKKKKPTAQSTKKAPTPPLESPPASASASSSAASTSMVDSPSARVEPETEVEPVDYYSKSAIS
uniref:Uncharacterized protein n=1 Tax=Vitis vinifera TaxID=29760 RepID=A5BMM4_VITVI|nr:hypothetical protein VITISV_017163 [Vitis vinifera]